METEVKYISLDEIIIKFSKLSYIQKTEILWTALDYMQQYNGRSRHACVAYAMGYHNIEGENGTWFKK